MMKSCSLLLAACVLFACGGDDGGVTADAAPVTSDGGADAPDGSTATPDAAVGALTLSSSALTEGAEIPLKYTCKAENISPPFEWAGGATAAGYALVFRDVEPGAELIHSVLYDIPGDVFSLPEGVEKVAEPSVPAGSKQTTAYSASVRGYLGPCPQNRHAYEFKLYALDTYPLPGVTLDSSRSAVETAIIENAFATDVLGIIHTP